MVNETCYENNYEELLNRWTSLNLPLIDLRSQAQFTKVHLLNSANIPIEQLGARGTF
jgi:rhodanese-related sulfurtransferase